MAQGFYPIRSPCLPAFPRHDSSCRDTIEDLKALLEITQALQPNQSYTCPSCSSTFSEEIILKLVNALIYTATQSCGSNLGGGGSNTGGISGGSGNPGGLIGGGNTIGLIGGGVNPGIAIGGGNTGPIGGGSNSGGIPSYGNGRGVPVSGGNTGMRSPSGNSPNGGSNGEGLIQVGLLDGQDTAHVDLGGQKLLGVDLGPQSGSGGSGGGLLGGGGGGGGSNDGLINLGLLNGGNDLLDLGLGGKKLLGVDLGPSGGNNNPSSTGNPGTSSQPSQPNYGNKIDNGPNTVPIANNNVNAVSTPVNVETIVYNGGGSQVAGNTETLTDGYNGFEGMAKPVIGS